VLLGVRYNYQKFELDMRIDEGNVPRELLKSGISVDDVNLVTGQYVERITKN